MIKKMILRILDFIIGRLPNHYRYRLRTYRKFFLSYEKVNIIDVGSYGGYIDHWKYRYIDNILAFDTIDNRKRKKTRIEKYFLWNKNEKINLYYTRGGGTDSLIHDFDFIKKNKKKLEQRLNKKDVSKFLNKIQIEKITKVNAKTLDSVLENIDIVYDFIKIDVQGAEKKVLQGAHKFLSQNTTLGLIIETYKLKFFKNQSNELEITKFLSNYGFVKVLQYPNHGSYGVSNDTLYIKEKIKNAKLNTILKTYNLIANNDGFYEN
jgi:FkbM family methyltransferase